MHCTVGEEVPSFLSCLLTLFRIYLTGLHHVSKGDSLDFVREVDFLGTFSGGHLLVVYFDDNRVKLCTSREEEILQSTLQGAHDSVLNACWQTCLSVETWLLFYTGDGRNVLVPLPHPHAQL